MKEGEGRNESNDRERERGSERHADRRAGSIKERKKEIKRNRY